MEYTALFFYESGEPLIKQLFDKIVAAILHKKKFFRKYLPVDGWAFVTIFNEPEFRQQSMDIILRDDDLFLHALSSSCRFAVLINACRELHESNYEEQLFHKLFNNDKIFSTIVKASYDLTEIVELSPQYSGKIADKIIATEDNFFSVNDYSVSLIDFFAKFPEHTESIISLLIDCSEEHFLSVIGLTMVH